MFDTYKLKKWISWPLIRAHLCTVAVAVGFTSTWRAPREAFRYGGLTFALVLTLAFVVVALPVVLLQLAIGQLSQQDAVGVWRAVPFFKGVGYLRLLVTTLSAIYTSVYLSLVITYSLYTLSNNIPFPECMGFYITPEIYVNTMNSSECLDETFLAPASEKPEYFLAVALILIVLWILFPFIFYNPVKFMKRIFYALGPLIVLVTFIILIAHGDKGNLSSFARSSDWMNFLRPDIWHGAIVQALISSQVAGGFLISAGDSVYSSTNVQWTAVAIVGANLLACWIGMIFWYSVTGPVKHAGVLAVLEQVYQTAEDDQLNKAWTLLVFALLFLSGVVSTLAFLYPVYDRLRRLGGLKWRVTSIACSLLGACLSVATLAGRLPALTLIEDTATPMLISLTTILEILPFIFIYGWKLLVEDVEFLIGAELVRYWVWGWCAAPGVIAPMFVWWLTVNSMDVWEWNQPPWSASTASVIAVLALLIFAIAAAVSVKKQVQFDFFGKLHSSFVPSRQWGPRDPITHYYWLACREETDRGNVPRCRYQRRPLGQLSTRPSFLVVPNTPLNMETKQRSNSDDWLYTTNRRKYLSRIVERYVGTRKRSKSLDWDVAGAAKKYLNVSLDSILSVNNNDVVFKGASEKVLK